MILVIVFYRGIQFHDFSFLEERQNAPSDLDSLSAQQLDEKFKEIMMKKRGIYVYM